MVQTAIEIKRHYSELSEKETGEVVEAVADMIVNFLMGRRDPARAGANDPERNRERDREQSNAR